MEPSGSDSDGQSGHASVEEFRLPESNTEATGFSWSPEDNVRTSCVDALTAAASRAIKSASSFARRGLPVAGSPTLLCVPGGQEMKFGLGLLRSGQPAAEVQSLRLSSGKPAPLRREAGGA